MKIERDVPLARHTTLGTGGPARFFARPETLAELEEALALAEQEGLRVAVVGLGSNLLAADESVDRVVIRLTGELAAVTVEGERVIGRRRRDECGRPASRARRRGSAASSSHARSRARPEAGSG